MKQKQNFTLKGTKCDLCGLPQDKSIIDAPVGISQPWAYMCEVCYVENPFSETVGTLYTFEKKKVQKRQSLTNDVIERSSNDDERLVACPYCDFVHSVEPDADYSFICHNCNEGIQCHSQVLPND